MLTALIPLLVLGTLASIWDVRTRRIPNVLTFGGSALAIVVHLVTGGWSGAAWSAGGWVIGCALFLPFFALGGMGAGDVKLMAAIGAWIGPWHAFWGWAFAAVAGGVLAVIVALLHGYLKQALRNIWGLLIFWRVVGVRPLDDMTLAGSAGPRVAYALPITLGSIIALLVK